MRRDPYLRPENQLAGGLDDIERLKEALSKITDGHDLVISSGSGPGTTTPPPEASKHVLYGSKHSYGFLVEDGGGLVVDYGQGQIWSGGTFYSIVSGSLTLDDNATNYVYITFTGTIAYSAVAYPYDCTPLAVVVAFGGDIISITDNRSYLTGAVHSWPPPGTVIASEDDSPVNAMASTLDFIEPDAVLVTMTSAGEVEIEMSLYALLAGRSGGQTLIGGLVSGENMTLQSNVANDASIFLGSASEFELDESTGQLKLPTIGPGAGIVLGGDVLFYRRAADILRIDARVEIEDANFWLGLSGSDPRINYDANDYAEYDRAGNYFNWIVGSSEALRLGAGYLHLASGYIQLEDVATPANPAADDYRIFTRVVGNRIHFVGKSMTGDECIICDLPNVAPPAHINILTLNWIE